MSVCLCTVWHEAGQGGFGVDHVMGDVDDHGQVQP